MLGALNQQQIIHLLQGQLVGRLGCTDGSLVYVVPITYVYTDGFVYAHTREGRKVTLARAHPAVCFEVDDVRDLANWQSVVVQGKYEELSGREAEEAWQRIINRIHPLTSSDTAVPRHALARTHSPSHADTQVVVFRIRIVEATGRFEKQ